MHFDFVGAIFILDEGRDPAPLEVDHVYGSSEFLVQVFVFVSPEELALSFLLVAPSFLWTLLILSVVVFLVRLSWPFVPASPSLFLSILHIPLSLSPEHWVYFSLFVVEFLFFIVMGHVASPFVMWAIVVVVVFAMPPFLLVVVLFLLANCSRLVHLILSLVLG